MHRWIEILFIKRKEPETIKKFEVNWKKTDIESLKFIHSQAMIRVQDTIKDHGEISKRVFSILLIVLGVTGVNSAWIFSQFYNVEIDWLLLPAGIIVFLACVFYIHILVQLLRPNKFRAPGREPAKMLTNEIFEVSCDDDKRIKALIYIQLLNCHAQITTNQHYNTIRLEKIDVLLKASPFIFSFIVLITLFSQFI